MSNAKEALIKAIAELQHAIDEIDGAPPGTYLGQVVAAGGYDQVLAGYAAEREANLAKPAPFGRDPGTEKPRAAPSWSKCRALWTAAMNQVGPDGKPLFDYWAYATGLQSLSGGDAPHHVNDDPQAFEDAVLALGRSAWGQFWLSFPQNRAMIDKEYRDKFGV